jgi:Leucine-rich repeat (LRR) protein
LPDDWFNSRTCLLEEMAALRSLDLSHNRIAALPISVYFNQELQTLRVAGNSLKALPLASPGASGTLNQQDYMDLLRAKVPRISSPTRQWHFQARHRKSTLAACAKGCAPRVRPAYSIWFPCVPLWRQGAPVLGIGFAAGLTELDASDNQLARCR